jgi:hypothetical protein
MLKDILKYVLDHQAKIFWIVAIVFIAVFIGNSLFHDKQIENRYFTNEFHGKIQNIKYTQKGTYILQVDTSLIYLSLWGTCIDSISVGDSIFKPSNSFEITIKQSKEDYLIGHIYDCTKW